MWKTTLYALGGEIYTLLMSACENPALLKSHTHPQVFYTSWCQGSANYNGYIFVQQSKTGKTLNLFDSLSNKNLELAKEKSELEKFPDF